MVKKCIRGRGKQGARKETEPPIVALSLKTLTVAPSNLLQEPSLGSGKVTRHSTMVGGKICDSKKSARGDEKESSSRKRRRGSLRGSSGEDAAGLLLCLSRPPRLPGSAIHNEAGTLSGSSRLPFPRGSSSGSTVGSSNNRLVWFGASEHSTQQISPVTDDEIYSRESSVQFAPTPLKNPSLALRPRREDGRMPRMKDSKKSTPNSMPALPPIYMALGAPPKLPQVGSDRVLPGLRRSLRGQPSHETRSRPPPSLSHR